MAGNAVSNVYRLVQRTKWANSIAVLSAFHLMTEGEGPTAQQVAQDWANNIVPVWKNNTAVSLAFENIQTQSLVPNQADLGGVSLAGTGAWDYDGSNWRVAGPIVVAGVITWRTNAPGRSGRGRTYVGGAPLISNDGINWAPANKQMFTNIAEVIQGRYILGDNPYDLRLCVWSRKNQGAGPPYNAAAAQRVVSFTVQSYYATMGSRRGGRGL